MILPATINEYTMQASNLDDLANEATDLLAQLGRAPEIIEDNKVYGAYGDLSKLLRQCWINFDARRKKRTAPLDESKKLIMGDFKPWLERLDNARTVCRDRQGTYDDKREATRIKEENRITKEREEQALKDAEALEAAGKPVEAEALIAKAAAAPVLDTTPEKVRGTYGSVTSSRGEWGFEVVSLRELPNHLVTIVEANEKAMNAARVALKDEVGPLIRAGTQEAPVVIPGLKIEFKRTPTTR